MAGTKHDVGMDSSDQLNERSGATLLEDLDGVTNTQTNVLPNDLVDTWVRRQPICLKEIVEKERQQHCYFILQASA